MDSRIIVGISHGDINGVSYEVILKTLAEPKIVENIIPVVYGSSKVAAYYRKSLDIQGVNLNIVNNISEINPKKINLINCTDDELKVELGKSTDEAGKAAFIALERATADLEAGHLHALVTAPINKKNIQTEGFHFPGHTEYLEEKFGNGSPALMLMVNDVMKIAVVTGHIPVNEIKTKLTSEKILEKIVVLNQSLKKDFMVIRPRIAILGLNPHAGDEGLIGDEETTILKPAMQEADKLGIICVGPYPADGFFGSGTFQKFDGILAMYHDQGLIPFKTLAMENGVNFTAGLPIVRTSPAHGTAYNIAGQNIASESSFREALFMAADVVVNRRINEEISANPLKTEQRSHERGGNRIA